MAQSLTGVCLGNEIEMKKEKYRKFPRASLRESQSSEAFDISKSADWHRYKLIAVNNTLFCSHFWFSHTNQFYFGAALNVPKIFSFFLKVMLNAFQFEICRMFHIYINQEIIDWSDFTVNCKIYFNLIKMMNEYWSWTHKGSFYLIDMR